MTATHVTWSAILDDADAPCVTRAKTQILHSLDLTGDAAAAQVFKWWLEDAPAGLYGAATNWDAEIDSDATEASALVVIHEPAALAGTYAIEVERVVEARGYEAEPDDIARAEAILAQAAKGEPA